MREKVKLVSSAGTGHFYTTTKNKRTTTEKLEFKKFDINRSQQKLALGLVFFASKKDNSWSMWRLNHKLMLYF